MRHQTLIIGFAVTALAASPAGAAGTVPQNLRTMSSAALCAFAISPGADYAAAVYPMQIAACTKEIEKLKNQGKTAAPAYDNRGKIYAQQGDCGRAITDYSKAIALNTGSPYPYIDRGLCYQKTGQTQKALVDFDSAIASAQGRKAAGIKHYITSDALFTLFIHRGRILLHLDQTPEAQRSFKAALFIRPKDAKVKALLAKATAEVAASQTNAKLFHACSNPNPIKSIASCTKLIKSPSVPPNMQIAAYQERGVAYDRNNQQEKALADFTTILKRKPDNAPTYLMRGVAHAQLHQMDQAIDDFSAAIRIEKDFAKAYVLRGRAYEQEGASQKAVADYTKAIALAPESVEARNRLKGLKAKLRAGSPATDAGDKGEH